MLYMYLFACGLIERMFIYLFIFLILLLNFTRISMNAQSLFKTNLLPKFEQIYNVYDENVRPLTSQT